MPYTGMLVLIIAKVLTFFQPVFHIPNSGHSRKLFVDCTENTSFQIIDSKNLDGRVLKTETLLDFFSVR